MLALFSCLVWCLCTLGFFVFQLNRFRLTLCGGVTVWLRCRIWQVFLTFTSTISSPVTCRVTLSSSTSRLVAASRCKASSTSRILSFFPLALVVPELGVLFGTSFLFRFIGLWSQTVLRPLYIRNLGILRIVNRSRVVKLVSHRSSNPGGFNHISVSFTSPSATFLPLFRSPWFLNSTTYRFKNKITTDTPKFCLILPKT